jgi:hypothetical protein
MSLEKSSTEKKWDNFKMYVCLLGPVFLLLCFLANRELNPSKPEPRPLAEIAANELASERIDAIYMAQEFVTDQLKTPSTPKSPNK